MKLLLLALMSIMLFTIADARFIMPPLSDNIAAPKFIEPPVETKTVPQLISHYSAIYKVDEKLALRIATCESGLRPWAKNESSSAAGVFQHIQRYWPARAKKFGFGGASVFDAEANVAVSIGMLSTQGTTPWNASKKCWNRV